MKFLAFAAGFAAGVMLASAPRCCSPSRPGVITDTLTVRDTLLISVPAASGRVSSVRYLRLPLSVAADSGMNVTSSADAWRSVTGITVTGDSVSLPVSTVVYSDSNYRAVVTGVAPSLDSLTIFPLRHTIMLRSPAGAATSPRSSRWCLGVTAGISASPSGFAPGVTIGVTYRLF